MKTFWSQPLCAASLLLAATAPAHSALMFTATLDASQVVSNASTETGTGFATFTLNDAMTTLDYTLNLTGLNLEPEGDGRSDPSDVDKIHLHVAPPGTPGPHVLNIFGLPSEDDNDLVVDFVANSLTGRWDDGDAIDPNTGNPFDQSAGGTTKFFSDHLNDLLAGNLYIAVHTAGQGGQVAIRGQLQQVPLPASIWLLLPMLIVLRLARRSGGN